MKVAVFSSKGYDQTHLEEFNQEKHQFSYFSPHLNEHTVALSAGCEAVCCFVNDQLNARCIELLAKSGIKYIVMRCAGYNNVDLKACAQHNIKVCRVPAYSPYAVAEHAVALIMDLNRNIHRAYSRVRDHYYLLDGLLGFDMHNKVVGVIGTGKIGQCLIKIMQGFGCQVIAYDVYKSAEVEKLGVEYTTLDDLFARSHIISLHCPLTPETHHMINDEAVNKMKKNVMIINTSRGGLVDSKAVINGLKREHIGYLGLDVYEEESDLFFEDLSNSVLQDDVFARLLTFQNVVITGHQGFFTKEALDGIATVTIHNITALELGDFEKAYLIE